MTDEATVSADEVTPIHPQLRGCTTITVDPDDLKEVRELDHTMTQIYASIGEERVAQLVREQELLNRLQSAQSEYGVVVRSLSKKYIPKEGSYQFNLSLGAFIGFEAPEEEDKEE